MSLSETLKEIKTIRERNRRELEKAKEITGLLRNIKVKIRAFRLLSQDEKDKLIKQINDIIDRLEHLQDFYIKLHLA